MFVKLQNLLWIACFVCAAQAQEVTVSAPDLFCKVEQFSSRKVKSNPFKRCDSLKDSANVKVKSLEDCKARATGKAGDCLKLVTSTEQILVKGKFTEKFSVSEKSTSFTCEMDSKGGQSCP